MGRPPAAAAATGRRPAAPPAFDHHRIRLGSGPLLCLGLVVALLSTVSAHTWLFTKGRATMQASQVKPFRPRATAPAEATHAQLGPGQSMVIRWASSHNNTFTFAIIAGSDQEWFRHPDYFAMVDDYIASAPPGANEAVEKPRYHGSPSSVSYLNSDTGTVCAGGYCMENLFDQKIESTSAEYIGHNLDLSLGSAEVYWEHAMYTYNPDITHNEARWGNGADWTRIPDRRVAYESAEYPWIVAAYRFHNKVNMHSDWDLVNMDLPARVFTPEYIAAKGQHHMVHFISRAPTQATFTDVVDIHALPNAVDPWTSIYGELTDGGGWSWSRTDHCQFIEPSDIATPVYNATDSIERCLADTADLSMMSMGICVVPPVNPDVVPSSVTREVELVEPICLTSCAIVVVGIDEGTGETLLNQTAGWCKKALNDAQSICDAATPVHAVTWANPLVSGVQYDSATLPDVRAGDYIAFEWDDVMHDVWLVPDGLDSGDSDLCNTTSWAADNQLIPPSHHATFNPFDDLVAGRNLFRVPDDAAGSQLTFICSLNGHCNAGQQLPVSVVSEARVPDPDLTEGVCPEDFTLCRDQSVQGETTAEIATDVNVPWNDPIGAEGLRLAGKVSRAATPWGAWKTRRIENRKCRSRPQNTGCSSNPKYYHGADHCNRPVWQFDHNALQEVVEACSSSYPEPCTGISWRGGINSTIISPASFDSWTWSRIAGGGNKQPWLDTSVGWIAGGGSKGEWIQVDLGEEMLLTGTVLQVRGNDCCGPQYVTSYRVHYAPEAPDGDDLNFTEITANMTGPTAEDWADRDTDPNRNIKSYFSQLVTARHVRFVVETHVGAVAMRAGVLKHVGSDMFEGEHEFRRCFESDGYTRVITVGELTQDETENHTLPVQFTKTVDCPGCYSCREQLAVPGKSGSTAHKYYWSVWGTYHQAVGFNSIVNNPGADNASLSVSVQIPYGSRLSWDGFDAEFVCRVDPTTSDPIDPALGLEEDSDWTTFLLPSSAVPEPETDSRTGADLYACKQWQGNINIGGGGDIVVYDDAWCRSTCTPVPAVSATMPPECWRVGIDTANESATRCRCTSTTVIDAIVAGFLPPEAAKTHKSLDQNNLGAVYPPGEQVDRNFHLAPGEVYHSRNWSDLSNAFDRYVLPAQELHGERGGGWWPPKPAVKVTFMPDVPTCSNMGHGKCNSNSPDIIAAKMNGSNELGWHVDSGYPFATHVNAATGETAEYGWRCQAEMYWYGHGWNNLWFMEWPVFDTGNSRNPGRYHDGINSHETCPDGRRNAWEITVPNGVYSVTVGSAFSGAGTCYFENHAHSPGGDMRNTVVFSVEVSDGAFTLEDTPSGGCGRVGWIKLDLVSETLFPAAWLPSPPQEWYQLELDEPTSDVGLVRIIMPHEGYQTAASYPDSYTMDQPDCRQGWLYAPAKCFRYAQTGYKFGTHPDLASYPDFPGFAPQFLGWLFDLHDTQCENGYGKRNVASCAGTANVLTAADCAAAAVQLGLDDTTPNVVDLGSVSPIGCLWEESNTADERLLFNTNGQEFDQSTGPDQVTNHLHLGSICLCDNNSTGVLTYGEFVTAQTAEVRIGPYAFWERGTKFTGAHDIKNTNAYHQDNMAHLWQRTNVLHRNSDASGLTRDEFINGMLSRPRNMFCDLFEATRKTHGGNLNHGACRRNYHGTNSGVKSAVPTIAGPFSDDGNHGFKVMVSDVQCTDDAGCPSPDDPSTNTTLCAFKLVSSGGVEDVDCGGATGRFVQIVLPGAGTRLFTPESVTVHRSSMELEGTTADSTDSALPMVCYGLVARPVPAPDDPDLLAGTKLHPKQIVSDNPEDPIFWSTCYDRIVMKTWLPLEDAADPTNVGGRIDHPYSFLNSTRCLSCDSARENYVEDRTDIAQTTHWWLQPGDQCTDCNYELFNITAAPTMSAPTASPATTTPTLAPVTHYVPWGRTTGAGGTLDVSSFTIGIVAFDVVCWQLVTGGHDVASVGTGGSFTSSSWMFNAGDEYCITITEPGAYGYRCSPHSDMVGTIFVARQGITESPTTSEPTAGPTPAPTHAPLSACIFENATEFNPGEVSRTYSRATREYSALDSNNGWVAGGGSTGEWMQIDIGEAGSVIGVATQARANTNNGVQYVTSFRIKHSLDGVTFADVPGILMGPTAEDTAASIHTRANAYFPSAVIARYVRIVVETHVGAIGMRGGLLVHADPSSTCITETVDAAVWVAGFSSAEAAALQSTVEDMLAMTDVSECTNSLRSALVPRFTMTARHIGDDSDQICILAENVANTGAGFVFVRLGDSIPAHLQVSHPAGTDPATQRYSLGEGSWPNCDSGQGHSPVALDDCNILSKSLVPETALQGRTGFIAGGWAGVDRDCSLQSGGDWATHFGTNTAGSGSSYSPVCRDASAPSVARAFDLFASTKARSLVVAGAVRDATTAASACQPEKSAADAAHNEDVITFVAAQAISAYHTTAGDQSEVQPWTVMELSPMPASSSCDDVLDYQAGYFLAVAAANECPAGTHAVGKADCVAAAISAGVEDGREVDEPTMATYSVTGGLRFGSWEHVPPGCNIYTTGSFHPMFNNYGAGDAAGATTYRPVCYNASNSNAGYPPITNSSYGFTTPCVDVQPPPSWAISTCAGQLAGGECPDRVTECAARDETTTYVLGTPGDNACPYGTHINSAAECDAAFVAVMPSGVVPGRSRQTGTWDNVAAGCSYQSGGDSTLHFNSHASPSSTAIYTPICRVSTSADCYCANTCGICRRRARPDVYLSHGAIGTVPTEGALAALQVAFSATLPAFSIAGPGAGTFCGLDGEDSTVNRLLNGVPAGTVCTTGINTADVSGHYLRVMLGHGLWDQDFDLIAAAITSTWTAPNVSRCDGKPETAYCWGVRETWGRGSPFA